MKEKTGFLGRFQPFHEGHKQVIEEYRDQDGFFIIIGSAGKSCERENPLNLEERKNVIHSCYPDLEIVGVEDNESDEVWAEEIKKTADQIISRNQWVHKALANSSVEIIEQKMHQENVYSATEVRRRIRSGEEWRYLVPDCAIEVLEQYLDSIKESGIQYEFQPGWKRENASR